MAKKIMLLLIALMFAFVIFNDYAWGQFRTGSDLVMLWRSHQQVVNRPGNTTGEEVQKSMWFKGYVSGVVDARVNTLYVPPGVIASQLCHIVGQYLDAHPNEWHENGADLVVKAIRNAFPKK
jgi:hypothetical protein